MILGFLAELGAKPLGCRPPQEQLLAALGEEVPAMFQGRIRDTVSMSHGIQAALPPSPISRISQLRRPMEHS